MPLTRDNFDRMLMGTIKAASKSIGNKLTTIADDSGVDLDYILGHKQVVVQGIRAKQWEDYLERKDKMSSAVEQIKLAYNPEEVEAERQKDVNADKKAIAERQREVDAYKKEIAERQKEVDAYKKAIKDFENRLTALLRNTLQTFKNDPNNDNFVMYQLYSYYVRGIVAGGKSNELIEVICEGMKNVTFRDIEQASAAQLKQYAVLIQQQSNMVFTTLKIRRFRQR